MPAPTIHAFAEKVALVTGGESSVGRAAALQLALNGCYVIVAHSGRDRTAGNLLNELKNLGTLAHFIETDFSDETGADKLIGEVENIFGRLDLLVNCTDINSSTDFENCDEQIFTEIVSRSLKTVFFVSRAAIRLMQSRPKPKIVNVVSIGENETNALAAAMETAITGFTQSFAKSLPSKFRVNCLSVKEKKSETSDAPNELFRQINGLSPDDAARAILFLLSGEAIGINGENIVLR